MFKFKIIFTDGTKKILKSNDKQKILDYIKDNLLNIREVVRVKEDDEDYIKFSSEEDKIKKDLLIAASLDGDSVLRKSDDPDDLPEEVKLAAIKQDSDAIRFLDNPSEEIQLAAIKGNPYSMKFIAHPTEKVKQLKQKLTSKE